MVEPGFRRWQEDHELRLLGWSATQAHMLSGGGKMGRTYSIDQFRADEMPHFYLLRNGAIHDVIDEWLREENRRAGGGSSSSSGKHVLNGAWQRTEFRGGDYVDSDSEVFNIQAGHLFIDLRFPADRDKVDVGRNATMLEDLSVRELRFMARQHCFAGYGIFSSSSFPRKSHAAIAEQEASPHMDTCTRHHAIDWNYHPQYPRKLPNKWRFVFRKSNGSVPSAFDEYGVIQNELGQPIYCESWKRYPLDANGQRVLAMRRCRREDQNGPDPVTYLCISGVHFAYASDARDYRRLAVKGAVSGGCANLVDAAYRDDNAPLMRDLLRIEGSYGRIDQGWKIIRSTYRWREGEPLLCVGRDRISIELEQRDLAMPFASRPCVVWNGVKWSILESTFPAAELVGLFVTFMSQARL